MTPTVHPMVSLQERKTYEVSLSKGDGCLRTGRRYVQSLPKISLETEQYSVVSLWVLSLHIFFFVYS